MTCKHCGQPIQRCPRTRTKPGGRKCSYWACRGSVHAADQQHSCEVEFEWHSAEPEPRTLPVVEAPASKPEGAVA